MAGRNNWKAYALTLLAILTAVSMSLVTGTMGKYKADVTIQATANVAKWKVYFTTGTDQVVNNSVVYLRYGTLNSRSQSDTRYYYVKNESDVGAKITVKLTYKDVYNNACVKGDTEWTYATFDCVQANCVNYVAGAGTKTATVGPNGTAAFRVIITGCPSTPANETYVVRAFAWAEQAD